MKVIALTGTPGTGKTKASKRLRRFNVVELNREVRRRRLYSSYDRKRRSFVVDMAKVRGFVSGIGNGPVMLDSHVSHLLPPSMVDRVIVLRCRPDRLEKRLAKRGWSAAKVRENVEAELMGIISAEARERHKNVRDIDTTDEPIRKVAKEIERLTKKRGKDRMIDWMGKVKKKL